MKLTIIGASGHGRVAADIARLNGYDEIVFLDDNETLTVCGSYPVVGGTDVPVDGDVFVAVGNSRIREKLSYGRQLITLIHPDAVIAEDVKIGKGTVVMAGTVINPGTRIGRGCIVNTSSSIDHDCSIGDFCHVSVGSHLCGTVKVGDMVWIGAGSTISNNVNICSCVTIGAGATVINDIEEGGTYIGVLAKKMNKDNKPCLAGGAEAVRDKINKIEYTAHPSEMTDRIGSEMVRMPVYDDNEEWVKNYKKQFGTDPTFF